MQDPVHGKGVHVEAALFDFALRGVVFGERLLKLLQGVDRTQLSVLEQMQDLLGAVANRYEMRLVVLDVLDCGRQAARQVDDLGGVRAAVLLESLQRVFINLVERQDLA